jgi:hypothetical protein
MMFVPHWKHRPPLPGNGDSFTLLFTFLCEKQKLAVLLLRLIIEDAGDGSNRRYSGVYIAVSTFAEREPNSTSQNISCPAKCPDVNVAVLQELFTLLMSGIFGGVCL